MFHGPCCSVCKDVQCDVALQVSVKHPGRYYIICDDPRETPLLPPRKCKVLPLHDAEDSLCLNVCLLCDFITAI